MEDKLKCYTSSSFSISFTHCVTHAENQVIIPIWQQIVNEERMWFDFDYTKRNAFIYNTIIKL